MSNEIIINNTEIPMMSIGERLSPPSISTITTRRKQQQQQNSDPPPLISASSSRRKMIRHLNTTSSSQHHLVFSLSFFIYFALIFCCVDAASSSNRHLVDAGRTTGGCKAVSRCCRGKDSSCFTTGPRMATARRTADRKCYCDETCRLTRDCCADYQDYCTRRDCVVSDWGQWGQCSHECGVGVSERERKIIADATNGGQACPPLKQKRVCIGTTCIAQRSILSKTYKAKHYAALAASETAKVLPAAFGSWRRHKLYDARQDIRRNLYANEMDKPEALAEQKRGYCGRYRVITVSHGCQIIPWVMSMMPVGGEVCAECQPEAMKTNLGNVCKGHGEIDKATRFTTPIKNYCYGTWQLLGDMTDTCSCPQNSTLIFV